MSDHNPGKAGYCHAWDLSHDPANGCDCDAIAKSLAASRDTRVKYIIRRKQIWSPAKGWHAYTGTSHNLHMHVSVWDTKTACEDTRPWPGIAEIVKPQVLTCTRTMGARKNPTWLSLIVGKFEAGKRYVVIGTGNGGKWLRFKFPNGKQGWGARTHFE